MLHGRFQDAIGTNLEFSQKRPFIGGCLEATALEQSIQPRALSRLLMPLMPSARNTATTVSQAVWRPLWRAVAGSQRSGRVHWSRP